MKNKLFLAACLLIASFISILQQPLNAQGIYQLWGTTPSGGIDDRGVLFSAKFDGTGYAVQKTFTSTNPGRAELFCKPLVYNSKFYCYMSKGGLNDAGIIAEFNPATNAYTKKADLHSIGGNYSSGTLILHNNKMYGLSGGGINEKGIIFEFNPANSVLTKLYDFNTSTGSYPGLGLTVLNSKFYGTTSSGGVNDNGVLFEFNPATNVYAKKYDFLQSVVGRSYKGYPLTVYSGKLWGCTEYGSLNDKGAIYSFDPATNIVSKKADLSSIGIGLSQGALTLMNNKFYGASNNGGNNNLGAIFEFNPATNILTKEFDHSYSSGRGDMTFTVYNNKLYSCSEVGIPNYNGVLFSYNPATNIFTSLLQLTESIGIRGSGAVTLYNNKLWATTTDAGEYGDGSMISYDLINGTSSVVLSFGGNELQYPCGQLMYYNNKIYGTAARGGIYLDSTSSGSGIYEYDMATGVYTMKVSMQSSDGKFTDQGGFVLLNNKFYGVTKYGGTNLYGTLFEYDPATNIFAKKHDFAYATGYRPTAQLAVYNNKLYGTCSAGSTNDNGNIFEYNPTTNAYAQKVILDNAKGTIPYGRMTLYNNKFYGMCFSGGTGFDGTIFEYNPAINSFIKKKDLDNVNGARPFGALTEYDGKLYGMTLYGGNTDSGVIIQYDPLTNILTKKKDLNFVSGKWPFSNLVASNNKLYGMNSLGGTSEIGTLFQFDPATDIYTKRLDFTPENGKKPRSNEMITVPAPVAPGSLGSCTNSQTININAANANQWIAFTDAQGRAVAEINANGNILGNTTVRYYINGGTMRQDGNGAYYLDRTITVTPTTQPTTDVSLRLYIRKTEFDNLAATPGSGVSIPSDLNIVKNTDFCASALSAATTPFTSVAGNWGTDYVYSTNASSLGSFYFIGNVAPPTSTLYLRLFIQGYYTGGQLMQSVLLNQGVGGSMFTTDSIDVEIRNVIAPYALVATVRTILQVGGTAVCNFPSLNGSYYIVIKHRQALQTWSANPVMLGALPVSYDFSTASNKAFGNNMFEVETGVWAIYGGDINQDENIDLIDLSILEQDISNFAFGYKATDLNGDGNVDLLDSPILEINVSNFVYSNHP